MKAWDIYTWEFPFGKHPVVIVSHPDRVTRKPDVNVLKCSSKRAARSPEPNELMLDEADGLDWPTLCACDLIFAVDKAELTERRGSVTPVRRRAIVSRVIQSFAWNQL
jgi:hypothetical protein